MISFPATNVAGNDIISEPYNFFILVSKIATCHISGLIPKFLIKCRFQASRSVEPSVGRRSSSVPSFTLHQIPIYKAICIGILADIRRSLGNRFHPHHRPRFCSRCCYNQQHMTHTTKSNAIIFFIAFNLLFILLFFYLFRVATPNKDSQYFVLIIHISCNFYIYVRIISYRKRICSILGNFNFLVKRSILTFQIMESPILIYQAKIHIC